MGVCKIPPSEKIWVICKNNGKITHIITSKLTREQYFLYTVNDDMTIKKIAKGKSPIDLEKKHQVFGKNKY